MTLEMANGIDFGQCVLVFELRDGKGKVRILRKHRRYTFILLMALILLLSE